MPACKNLKQVEAHHRRTPRQASASQFPPPRPPSERVLLRRIYFLNSEHYKYVCLGFYSEGGHRALLELGGARQAPQVHPSLVRTLALHLPNMCEHLARGERYRCNEMPFRMQTLVDTLAKIALDRTSVNLRLPELEYLLLNLPIPANHLARYRLTESDVSEHVQSATGAKAFMPNSENACLFVQHDVLFEEITGNLRLCVL